MTPPDFALTSPRLRLTSALVVAMILGWSQMVAAPSAAAHDVLLSSVPAAGAQVTTVPTVVVLTFSQPVPSTGTVVRVTGPAGAAHVGPLRRDGARVSQALRPGAPAGRYLVRWQVVSDDGHPISGQLTFTARSPGPAQSRSAVAVTPSSAAEQPERVDRASTGGSGAVVALVLLAVLLPLGALVVARRRRA